jgi:RNA polymerase sigma-70 factor, ECF subfamily
MEIGYRPQTHPGFRASTHQDDSDRTARAVTRAIAQAKAGNRDGIRVLYIEYADNVYGYIRSIVGEPYDAEDLTQRVFTKLIFAITKYEDRGVAFLGWLLRLARNVALDHLRARRAVLIARECDGVDLDCGSPEEGENDAARNLRAALDSLPEDQRSVAILRYVVGLKPAEIATQLGRSESSIYGLHHRGRRALKSELIRLGSTPAVTTMRARRAAAGPTRPRAGGRSGEVIHQVLVA